MGVDGPSNSNHEHLWLKYIAVDKKNLTLGWLGNGPVAQRLEQGTHNPLVPGSNPGGPSLRLGAQRKRRLPRRNKVEAGGVS